MKDLKTRLGAVRAKLQRGLGSFKSSADSVAMANGSERAARGFTLIELLITLTIASILLTVVGPSLRTFINSNELIGATNDFVTHLSLTRSEALKRGKTTGICKSGGGAACVATGTWDTGWIMFADADDSNAWSAGDTLFRVYVPTAGHTTLTASGNSIVFDRQGRTGSASTFTFCNSVIGKSRIISINQFGQHTVSQGTC